MKKVRLVGAEITFESAASQGPEVHATTPGVHATLCPDGPTGGWPTQVWVPHSIAHFAIEWGSEAACSSPSPVRSLPNFPRKRSSLPECVLHSHAPVRPPAVFHSLQLCVSEPSGVTAEIKLRRREGIGGIVGRIVTPLNRTKRD
jgi:hypothetical protein